MKELLRNGLFATKLKSSYAGGAKSLAHRKMQGAEWPASERFANKARSYS